MQLLLPSWAQNRGVDTSHIVWISAASIVLAYLLHRSLYGKRTHAPEKEMLIRRHQNKSRLLRQQFGCILDNDLALEEEVQQTSSTNNVGCEIQNKQCPHDDAKTTTEKIANSEEVGQHQCIQSQAKATGMNKSSLILSSSSSSSSSSPNSKCSKPAISSFLQTTTVTTSSRPPFLRSDDDDDHAGLNAFWRWCDVEASLFRIYTIPRSDGMEDETTIPPYNPSSRRGTVAIHLRVTNQSTVSSIQVYWIDFKGKYVPKGMIQPGHTWRQTTWIDHPWVFCEIGEENNETVLLHYIPYRVIPNVPEAPTIDPSENDHVGRHRFSILPNRRNDSIYVCQVDDPIFPYPASFHLPTTDLAVMFALLHCVRMQYNGWDILRKYLENILRHNDTTTTTTTTNSNNYTYRQIRTSNPTFAGAVWNTPARGVLLAAGFVENGAYVEYGCNHPLTDNAMRYLHAICMTVEQWQLHAEQIQIRALEQPEGADGYGRAGYRQL